MKKSIFSLIIIFLTFSLYAQQVPEQILVDKKDLPKEVLDKIEQKKEIESYGEWVGLGKEIGIAINEGLGAVVEQANNFGKTEVGTFTMALIAWAVVGKDILRILIGLPILLIGLYLIVKYYRKTFLKQKVVKKSEGFWIFGKREYEYLEPIYDGNEHGVAAFITLSLTFVYIASMLAVMLA